jgi:hypothetical protein
MCLELAGIAFLWSRVKRKAFPHKSFWDFRLLLYDLEFVVGSVFCFFEAFRLR